MNDFERLLTETMSYAVSFDGRVLFCRMCGHATDNPVDVGNRHCGNCHVWHDNTKLEEHLEARQ